MSNKASWSFSFLVEFPWCLVTRNGYGHKEATLPKKKGKNKKLENHVLGWVSREIVKLMCHPKCKFSYCRITNTHYSFLAKRKVFGLRFAISILDPIPMPTYYYIGIGPVRQVSVCLLYHISIPNRYRTLRPVLSCSVWYSKPWFAWLKHTRSVY